MPGSSAWIFHGALWRPGTASGYHAVTWGYLSGELVRRVTDSTLGELFNSRIAVPLQADFYIGVPDSKLESCANLIGPNHARASSLRSTQIEDKTSDKEVTPPVSKFFHQALFNPPISPFRDVGSRDWRKAEIAASNGHASAHGIAKIYAALANNGTFKQTKIVGSTALSAALKTEVDGPIDAVIGGKLRRTRGFMLNSEGAFGSNPASFGHSGAGGSIGFADAQCNLALGYAMNQMQSDNTPQPRSKVLLDAVYRCIV